MRKLYSLLKACMSSDMKLFKIKTKKNSRSQVLLPLFIAFYLMFMIWGFANSLFEKLAPLHIQHLLLSVFVFGVSFMTFVEGIYKSGSLMFNCKDDQLLLSLPIKKRTVLFVRIFKFYVFEVLFNALFLFPLMVAYIRWGDNISFSYYITSIIMLLVLPIVPIVLSCFVGALTSSIAGRFKYKNISQIVISMIFFLGVMFCSYRMNNLVEYLIQHANGLNDLIIKIYYPAGMYAKLITDFNILDLIIFILVHIVIFVLAIFILSRFYFKINSRMKRVITNKKINVNDMTIKKRSQTRTLIRKELNTFLQTPVFIINSGFALVLFIIVVIGVMFKFDYVINFITNEGENFGIDKDLILNNLSIIVLLLNVITAFMTSITNSVISLEGKSINILKSLPIKVKTILMSKIYACLVITTPVLFIGNILLFIKLKISIMESILLIMLSILMPLVSHFVGILVNLRYPKLDYENATEVVKQSTSSFMAVMIGMIILIINFTIITNVMDVFNSLVILIVCVIIYLIVDIILYMILNNKGVKEFNDLSI